jgi:hypothetical protein
MNGNKALVAYLLSNGARISIDKFGNSPLHDCSIGGFIECARMLLANDCDPCQKDNQNMTASDIAELYGHTEFVQEVRRFERKRLESLSKDNSSSSSTYSSNSSTKSSNKSNENKRSQLNNRSMRKTTSSHSIVNPIPASFIKPTTTTTDHEEQIKQMEEAISSVTSPIGCGGGSSYFHHHHHHHHSTSSAVSTSTPSSNQDTKLYELDKNTTTPSMPNKDDINLVNKENIVNINVQETRQQKSSNQVFIKIIRKDEFKSNNTQIVPNEKLNVNNINYDVSAIEELDKCIAEFEINTNLNKKEDQDIIKSSSSGESLSQKKVNKISDSNNNDIIETKNSKENVNTNNNNNNDNKDSRMNAINVLNQHFKKNPNMANNNCNMNYGNKNNQATTLPPSIAPPPPPPLPTNWLSLNEKSFMRSHQHK